MIDVFSYLLRNKVPRVTLDRRPRRRNQKLFKVPRDVRSFHGGPGDEERVGHQRIRVVMRRWEGGFKPIKDGMRSLSVDNAFLHEYQFRLVTITRADVLQILQNFIAVPVLLVAELIAGKSQDNKLLAELISKRVHLGIIPGGRASQRGNVLDEDSFALEHIHFQFRSGKAAAGQSFRRQVKEGLEGCTSQEHHRRF